MTGMPLNTYSGGSGDDLLSRRVTPSADNAPATDDARTLANTELNPGHKCRVVNLRMINQTERRDEGTIGLNALRR